MRIYRAGLLTAMIVGLGATSLVRAEDKAEERADEKGPAEAQELGPEKTIEITEIAIFQMIDKDSYTISFDKGSAAVSDAEKVNLKAAADAIQKDQKLKRVIVAAWSDDQLPVSDKVHLTDAARKLADDRAQNIRKILVDEGISRIDITTHSMAEHANWFQRMFKTQDAQIKKALEGKNIKNDVDKRLAEKLAVKGGPGKAAVIFVTEGSGLAH